MAGWLAFVLPMVAIFGISVMAQKFEKDRIETSVGNLEITFIGHGMPMFTFGEISKPNNGGLS